MLTPETNVEHVLADDIKKDWKLMWRNSIDDKVRAEGLASKSFPLLFVEQGTVIKATRDFKALELREIMFLHRIQDIERNLGPCPSAGGWTKFAKTVLNKQHRHSEVCRRVEEAKLGKNIQKKKCGRGWLHL